MSRLVLSACLLLAQAAVAATAVVVAEASVERFEDKAEALGTLRANESVMISTSITETVKTIHFDDGDRVKAGQLLVELNSVEEQALLEESKVIVDEARRQYERLKALQAQGQASASLLDERRREWQAGQARLRSIEARIADRRIEAPFAGVVGLRDVSVGALVEPGDTITTLDDDSVMKLEFPVPSTLLASLQPGLAVAATTQTYGDRNFSGRVTAIGSRVDPVTRSVMVRAQLPNPDALLRPGLLMHVQLSLRARESIVLPEEVLIPLGTQQFVLVVDEAKDNTVVRRAVRVGARRPGRIEIVEGLTAGEKVIAHGSTRVKAGEQVSILAVADGAVPLRELIEKMP